MTNEVVQKISPLKQRPRVALLVETSSAHSRRILQGIGDYMHKNGPWSVQFEPRGNVRRLPDWLATWDGDGIIARISEATAEPLSRSGIPMVNLYADYPLPSVVAPVVNDQEAIGRLAAEYFLSKHFHHFGFLGQPATRWSELRYKGFLERIRQEEERRDTGGKPRSCSCCCAGEDEVFLRDWGEEREKIVTWIQQLPRPTGILAASDYRAVQLLNVCREMGVPVPEQIAVLGVDNEDVACDLAFPTLSSVIPDHVRIGYLAAELLDRRMQGENLTVEAAPIFVQPLGVAERKSTETMAVEDSMVATALAFIRERGSEGINVQNVLDYLGISRCNLQARFRKSLDRTIHGVISTTRIEAIQTLLRSTDLSLEQIAERTGFRHLEYLHRFFKRETGKTLIGYRKMFE